MSDLIERQKAIDAANRADYRGLIVEDVKKVTDAVVEELKRLPSAGPRWIPMSERTPKVGQDVIVTTRNVRMYVVTYASKEWIPGHCFHWKPNFMGTEYLDENDVIAWMPLPEVYQEDV